jgi:hypothetical protein
VIREASSLETGSGDPVVVGTYDDEERQLNLSQNLKLERITGTQRTLSFQIIASHRTDYLQYVTIRPFSSVSPYEKITY